MSPDDITRTAEIESTVDQSSADVATTAATAESDPTVAGEGRARTASEHRSADDDDPLVEEGDVAGDYLERLLDLLDFDGDIDLDVEGDRAMVSIEGGSDLQKLVGGKGEVLDALQELTRLAVQQTTGDRSRLMLDVAGWRAGRRSELSVMGIEVAERVAQTGERESLAPMTPFERKIVHDAVAGVTGVESGSEGVEPSRHVVVLPAS